MRLKFVCSLIKAALYQTNALYIAGHTASNSNKSKNHHKTFSWIVYGWVCCMLALLMAAAPASATDFIVTTAANSGPGTLRQAILDANATAASGPHRITFSAGVISEGKILISAALPPIRANLTIEGPQQKVAIEATGAHRIMDDVSPGWTVSIYNLIIRNANSPTNGGGIYNRGNLSMYNCNITGNKATGSGGGIWNEGTILLDNCLLANNTTTSEGGAMISRNNASMTVKDCIIEKNQANGSGGGIIHQNNNTGISGNSIVRTIIRKNTSGNNGGGVNNSGILTILNSHIYGNTCTARGGGIGNEGSASVNMTISGCTINGNTATSNGGGVHFYTSNPSGRYQMVNTTLSGNTSLNGQGGGIGTGARGVMTNCTVAANNSLNGNGGGVRIFGEPTELNYCLIVGNNLSRSDIRGRDLDGNRSSATGRNIISTAANSPYGSWAAGSVLEGNNTQNVLQEDILEPLTLNGGTLPVHLPKGGGLAVNPAQRTGFASLYDQRGFSRSGTVDIGAAEYNGVMPSVVTGLATDIRLNSVQVSANVQVGSNLVNVLFNYGPTPAMTYTTSPVGVSGSSQVSQEITQGLAADQPYSYQAKAVYGSFGEYVLTGEVQTFRTPAANQAPVLQLSPGTAFVYTELGNAVVVDENLSLNDADNETLVRAFVRLSGGYVPGEDVLQFSPQEGITGTWNPAAVGGGTLALTGTAPQEAYQQLLRSVKYVNLKGEEATYENRTLTFTLDDGSSFTSASRGVVITFSENGPLITGIEQTASTYTENAIPVVLTSTLQLADPTSTELEGATIAISVNYIKGEDVLGFIPQGPIQGSWNTHTGVLTLSGRASVQVYQQALRAVTYHNTGDNPNLALRTITIQATDGQYLSNPARRSLQVIPVNDAPVLAGIEADALSHREGENPILLTSAITLADVDNTTLSKAVIWVSGSYNPSQDILALASTPQIQATWNASAGTLTLTGEAGLDQYQALLKQVHYYQLPGYQGSYGPRTLSFQVFDAQNGSNILTRTLQPSAWQSQTYNYAEALQKVIYFYECQRSGILPERGNKPGKNRVEWRGNSLLTDGSDAGVDLTGGWYDAGDSFKTNNTMAYAATLMAWSGIEYSKPLAETGQLPYLLDNLKWVNDYLLKCFVNDQPGQYKYFTQVTHKALAHGFWAAPEVLDELSKYVGVNPSFYIDVTCKGSDAAGQAAATFASSSIVFRKNGQQAYASLLLGKARSMFDFGYQYYGNDGHKNKNGVIMPKTDAGEYYYRSEGVEDEMMWAAIWLALAEKEQGNLAAAEEYRQKAIALYQSVANPDSRFAHFREFFYGDLAKGALLLMARETTGDLQKTFRRRLENHLDWWTIGYFDKVNYSPGGMASKLNAYAPLRYSTNQAFLAGIYADWMPDENGVDGTAAPFASPKLESVNRKSLYGAFARRQVEYALGNNPNQTSYLVGFGSKYYNQPHHRAAHGPWAGFEHFIPGKPEYNVTQPRHILYGGLLGGPNGVTAGYPSDGFNPAVNNITNSVTNEVALDFNAGLIGVMARLHQQNPGNGTVLDRFPPKEKVADEVYTAAQLVSVQPNAVNIKVQINNRSAWPARVMDGLSCRYYFSVDAGMPFTAVKLEPEPGVPNTNTEGAKVTGPFRYAGNVYYVNIDFSGWKIFPGGLVKSTNDPSNTHWMREANFVLSGNGSWNNTNDWSFNGLEMLSMDSPVKTWQIPVYDKGQLIFGAEPPAKGARLAAGETETTASLALFPNPASHKLTVDYIAAEDGQVKVEILNTLSVPVQSVSGTAYKGSNSLELNVSDLKNGVYFLRIAAKSSEQVGKFIIAR